MLKRIGDIVTISPDLHEGDYQRSDIGHLYCNSDMEKYSGMDARITKILYTNTYRIDIDGCRWCWCDGMFEDDRLTPHNDEKVFEVDVSDFDSLFR